MASRAFGARAGVRYVSIQIRSPYGTDRYAIPEVRGEPYVDRVQAISVPVTYRAEVFTDMRGSIAERAWICSYRSWIVSEHRRRYRIRRIRADVVRARSGRADTFVQKHVTRVVTGKRSEPTRRRTLTGQFSGGSRIRRPSGRPQIPFRRITSVARAMDGFAGSVHRSFPDRITRPIGRQVVCSQIRRIPVASRHAGCHRCVTRRGYRHITSTDTERHVPIYRATDTDGRYRYVDWRGCYKVTDTRVPGARHVRFGVFGDMDIKAGQIRYGDSVRAFRRLTRSGVRCARSTDRAGSRHRGCTIRSGRYRPDTGFAPPDIPIRCAVLRGSDTDRTDTPGVRRARSDPIVRITIGATVARADRRAERREAEAYVTDLAGWRSGPARPRNQRRGRTSGGVVPTG